MNIRHANVWSAIDHLARSYGLSPSGLAKKAGLDPTAFNRSKRINPHGRPRWPSMESIARILEATGAGAEDFLSAMEEGRPRRRIPVIGLAQAGKDGFFDDGGYPTGGGWDEIDFPDVNDRQAYALDISGDSMEPIYRHNDRIIVSPSSSIRRGDRVVVKTVAGEVMAKELLNRTATRVELRSFNPRYKILSLKEDELLWTARIIWASQ